MNTGTLLIIIATIILAPIIGGLLAGIDRKVTAWLQGRFGPPIVQPFYDVMKLFGKTRMVVNTWQVFCAYIYLFSAILSLILLVIKSDLLLILFVMSIGAVFLVMGALAAQSPYSQIGSQRELLQMLAYEPLIILVFVGIYLVTGSFKVNSILNYGKPLLLSLPLLFIVLTLVLTIKLRKSPFDISTSHHAHQEIVKGILTEYAGPYLAIVEVAHWYEIILILGIVALFWATNWIGAAILLVLTYFFELIIDNVMARMTWRWMLKYVMTVGLILSVVNIIWLYLM